MTVLLNMANMSWDKVREKSHDDAWRSTSINRPINFKDIVIEAGDDDEYIAYLSEQSILSKLSNLCSNGI
jgi:heat shock protein HspQ